MVPPMKSRPSEALPALALLKEARRRIREIEIKPEHAYALGLAIGVLYQMSDEQCSETAKTSEADARGSAPDGAAKHSNPDDRRVLGVVDPSLADRGSEESAPARAPRSASAMPADDGCDTRELAGKRPRMVHIEFHEAMLEKVRTENKRLRRIVGAAVAFVEHEAEDGSCVACDDDLEYCECADLNALRDEVEAMQSETGGE